MRKIRVGILGATGYTASESIRLLLNHPNVEIAIATSRQEAGQSIAQVHPQFAGRLDLKVSQPDPGAIAAGCDVAFSCLPHGASAETVKAIVEAGCRVVDFSADFRLGTLDLYQQWYEPHHPWGEMLGKVPYGLPELFEKEIVGAPVVANPGCYPTSAILPLAPLIAAEAIFSEGIIVDSKSGVSGAGRTPKLGSLYCEANESIAAYGVGNHRHQPEIVDIVRRYSGCSLDCVFTPHLTPMDRGILSTIYVRSRGASVAEMMHVLRQQYQSAPFVHVVDHLPATKFVAGTNHVQITARQAGDWVILLAVIDNLVKGAAGAAIQNLNCMFDLDQRLGLGG